MSSNFGFIPMRIIVFATLCLATTLYSSHAAAEDDSNEDAVSKCLAAWGEHPFGAHPKFKTLSTSVRVFGVGSEPVDDEVTKSPALILVNPAVNVMGGTTYGLLNPNGWYCFRATVNVMGGLTVKAHCKAHLASSNSGATVMGSNSSGNKGVTVMGSTKVRLVGCDKSK